MRGRFEPEREHFGIGRRDVACGRRTRCRPAGIRSARRTRWRNTGAEIAEAVRPAGHRRGQVIARDRDGQIGPQAQFAPVRIDGEEHALADVLAREIEERLRRLQDRGRDARIAGALVRARRAPAPARRARSVMDAQLRSSDGNHLRRRRFSTTISRFRCQSGMGLIAVLTANRRAPPRPAPARRPRRYRRAGCAGRARAAPRSAAQQRRALVVGEAALRPDQHRERRPSR